MTRSRETLIGANRRCGASARARDRAAIRSALVAIAPRRKSRRFVSNDMAPKDYADSSHKQAKFANEKKSATDARVDTDQSHNSWSLSVQICVYLWLNSDPRLDIKVPHIQRVVFDELAARLDGVTHQHGEDFVGFDSVVNTDLQERARLRVHRRFPQLFRIHFAQALVTLNREIFFRSRENAFEQGLARSDFFTGAVLAGDERRRESIFEFHEKLDRLLKLNITREIVVDRNCRARVGNGVDLPQAVFFIFGEFRLVAGLMDDTFDLGHQILILESSFDGRTFFTQDAFLAHGRALQGLEQMRIDA